VVSFAQRRSLFVLSKPQNTAGEPVIAHLAERVINVDANGTIDQVFEYVLAKLEPATN
jgi:hypothetical protein